MADDIIDIQERCGRCDRCHRKLKDPESVKRGLGPICDKKVKAELRESGKDKVPGQGCGRALERWYERRGGVSMAEIALVFNDENAEKDPDRHEARHYPT